MLSRYSKLKEDVAGYDSVLKNLQDSVNQQRHLVDKLKNYLDGLRADIKLQVDKECNALLEKELNVIRNKYQYDLKMVEQFKSEQTDILAQMKYNLESNSVIDTEDFTKNKELLDSTLNQVSSGVLKYMDEDKLLAFKGVDYGIDLIEGDLKLIKDTVEYFETFDGYDKLTQGISNVTDFSLKLDGQLLLTLSLVALALIHTYKYILVLPYLLFMVSYLIIRLREYFYLVRMVNAYLLLSHQTVEMDNMYKDVVSEHIRAEDYKLNNRRLYIEQVCNLINSGIQAKMEEELEKARDSFDFENAKELARENYHTSTDKTEETLKQEEDKYNKLVEEVKEMAQLKEESLKSLEELRLEIKRVYEQLKPSFKETTIISEFFLGFDDDDEPVTFNYKQSATMILYDGSLGGQVNAVMSTLKMMCGQIMCSMYPLAYTITIVDTLTSGAPLSAFQVTNSEEVGVSNLFKVVSTNEETKNLINSLYNTLQKRRVQVLGMFESINDYNEEKISLGARTLPYELVFFYHFDYKLINTDDKLKQICRLSKSLGIIPIFFIDTETIGEDERSMAQSETSSRIYKYKPEILLESFDLFQDNMFGFTIKDSVDIVVLGNDEVTRRVMRRNIIAKDTNKSKK